MESLRAVQLADRMTNGGDDGRFGEGAAGGQIRAAQQKWWQGCVLIYVMCGKGQRIYRMQFSQ